MKKTLTFTAFALSLVFCACQKEAAYENSPAEAKGLATLTCTLPASDDTKMGVAADGKVTWYENDSIMVYGVPAATPTATGVSEGVVYHLVSGAGTKTATFQGPAFSKEGYTARLALYPAYYSKNFQKNSANRLVMHINGTYVMTSAGEDQNIPAIMVSYINSGASSINFEHVASLLKLSFKGIPEYARKVKIFQDGFTTTDEYNAYGLIGDRYFTVTKLKGAGNAGGVTNLTSNNSTASWLNMSITFPGDSTITSGEGFFYFPITVTNKTTTRNFRVEFYDLLNEIIPGTSRTLTSDKFTAGKMISFPQVDAIAKPVAVESVSLDKTDTVIYGGATAALTATVLPTDANDQVCKWTSSDETVATVNYKGQVTAVGPGTAVITATTYDGGKTASCNVTVKYDGIASEADFAAFAASLAKDPTAAAFTNAANEVVLKADLNLGDIQPLVNFNGIFNGDGHSLTFNMVCDSTKVGLFQTLRGTVKNLTLDGSIDLSASGDLGKEIHAGAFAAETRDGVQLISCTNKVSLKMKRETVTVGKCIIISGLVGKIWGGITIDGCTNSGDILFDTPSHYLLAGGLVGAVNADDFCTTITGSSSTGKIEYNGTNASDWHYIGGLVGKPASTRLTGTTYGLDIQNSGYSGEIILLGSAKVRIGGIASYAKACNHFKNDTFSGKVSLNNSTLERNVGGICGFQEPTCQGLLEGCIFSGRIECEEVSASNQYYWIGGIISSGYAASSVIDGCKTTAEAYVANKKIGSIGMIAGRPNNPLTIRNCKIAGTIDNSGNVTIISAENIEDWMFKGSKTEKAVKLENNGYNDEM